MRKIALIVAATALIVSPAFAADNAQPAQQKAAETTHVVKAPEANLKVTVDTDKSPAKKAEPEKLKLIIPPVKKVSAKKCTLISVTVSAFKKDKPTNYWLTVKDKEDGLIADLAACNKHSKVIAMKAGSTKSALIHITQALNRLAYLKVPADRASRLELSFYITEADWNKARYWDSVGPIGQSTEIAMVAGNEKNAGHIYTPQK